MGTPPIPPTPDPASADAAGHRWKARPVLATALAALVYLTPLAGSTLLLILLSRLPALAGRGWTTVLVPGAAGLASAIALERVLRKLLPLTGLLRLSMLFPDRAPSRFKVARSAGAPSGTRRAGAGTPSEAARDAVSLLAALGAHDRRTRGHSERVRVFCDMLANELRLPEGDRDRLRWAALLHDLGKISVSTKILNKPAKLSAAEFAAMKGHPEAGAQLAAPLLPWLGEWGQGILHHHEKYDGTGYPAGLAGPHISRAGRLIAVVDAFETMTAARSYKKPMATKVAREELARCAGAHFDPGYVRAFLAISLPRLLWTMGPLSFLVQLPFLREISQAGMRATAGGQAATAMAGAAVVASASVSGASVLAHDHTHVHSHPLARAAVQADSAPRLAPRLLAAPVVSGPVTPAEPVPAEPVPAEPVPAEPVAAEPPVVGPAVPVAELPADPPPPPFVEPAAAPAAEPTAAPAAEATTAPEPTVGPTVPESPPVVEPPAAEPPVVGPTAPPPAPEPPAVPPVASLVSGPVAGDVVTSTAVTLSLTADDPVAAFECSTDGTSYAPCSSSPLFQLPNGPAQLWARAVDPVTGPGPSVTTGLFTVAQPLPQVVLSNRPPASVNGTSVSFDVASDDPAATLTCRLDSDPATPCSGTQSYSGLTLGTHTITVVAVNPLTGSTSSALTFTTTAYLAAFVKAPSGPTFPGAQKFTIAEVGGGASYEIQVDGAAWTASGSSTNLNLPLGPHTVSMRAVQAGVPLAAATTTYTVVDSATTLTSAPPATTSDTTATFAFTAAAGLTFECAIAGHFAPCTSPVTWTGLSTGSLTFRVRAVDSTGSTGPAQVYTWVIA